MSNSAEDKKYEGLAKEIVDLLIAFGEQYKAPEQENATKKAYAKPYMLEINQEQYRKFKNIIYFIHTLSDEDNDYISYNRSADGLDVCVEWKTPTLAVSKDDQSLLTLVKVFNMADSLSISVTGLDELTVKFTLKNFMIRLDKGNVHEGV